MNLPKSLSINYPLSPNERINIGFDSQIERLLARLGYRRWASGYDFETKMRDVAFEIREKK